MEETIKPVRIISSILTLSPRREIKLFYSLFYYSRALCIFILTASAVVYKQITDEDFSKNGGVIVEFVELAQWNCRIPVVFFCIAITNFNSGKIEDFLQEIAGLKCRIDYGPVKKTSRKFIIWTVLKLLLQQIPFGVQAFVKCELQDCLDYVIFNLPLVLIHVLLLQWIIYLNILEINFRSLNRSLSNSKNRLTWIKTRENRNSFIRKCGSIYDVLCERGRLLNSAFSWQILFVIPSLFILTISSSFKICRMLRGKVDFDAKILVFDFLYFISFLELIMPCIEVQEEAERFLEVLLKIDSELKEDPESLHALILQTHHQKIAFSACGIFPLDGTLLYSILGALTTYLVILLQFDV